jgi:ElaB/YqjD/DUF883 family membrane-anchored ribosome-binding protein
MIKGIARLFGLAFLAGMIIPPIAALITKRQMVDAGRGRFEPEADDLDAAVIFEGGEFESTAPAFTGGEVLTWYGGGRFDLRGATIAPEGADLRIRAIFGGVQLVVPDSWRVETDATSYFGGVADATTSPENADAPVLRLSTLAVFGGVAISNDTDMPMVGNIGDMIKRQTDSARDAVDEATAEAESIIAQAKAAADDASNGSGDAKATAKAAVTDAKAAAGDAADAIGDATEAAADRVG